MAVYIGVDFHARRQTVRYLTTEDGEIHEIELHHQNKTEVRAFYAQFTGEVIVGFETSGYAYWFEEMLEELVPGLDRRPGRDPSPSSQSQRTTGAMPT